MRRILKWVAIVLGVLVVAALLFVVVVLGVNPFEGKVDALWEVVSYQAHFYVHCRGADLLDDPFVERRLAQVGFEGLSEEIEELRRQDRELARQINPQIPLGLVEVEPLKDFFGKEVALAGTFLDYREGRLDQFLLVTRVPFYARFVSALRRDFIRSRIPDAREIEPIKGGSYFKLILTPEAAEALRPFRAPPRMGADDALAERTFYFGRIKDVILFTDNPEWIEDAIQRRSGQSLGHSPYFEQTFIRFARRGRSVELYLTQEAARSFVAHQFRVRSNSPLLPLQVVMPQQVVGDVTARLTTGHDRLGVEVYSTPSNIPDAFKNLEPYITRLYESEKADLRFLLGPEGLGQFIPKERTVAAVVFRMPPDLLAELVVKLLPRDMKALIDEEISANPKSGSKYRSLEDVLKEVGKNLGKEHLIVFHRPSYFEKTDYSVPVTEEEELFSGQLAVSVVLQVLDTVAAERVSVLLGDHLQRLGLRDPAPVPGTALTTMVVPDRPIDFSLVQPTYGPLPGGKKYVVLSSFPEGAKAILKAASDPQARLLVDEGAQAAVQRLPAQGNLGVLINGPVLQRHLEDNVREYVEVRLDLPDWGARWRQEVLARGGQPTPEARRRAKQQYIYGTYRDLRLEYLESLEWLGSLRAAAVAIDLSRNRIALHAEALFWPEEGEPEEE
ncbi:MAG: hypothetical protein ACE10D_00110 [Planctomycetota bacterium]